MIMKLAPGRTVLFAVCLAAASAFADSPVLRPKADEGGADLAAQLQRLLLDRPEVPVTEPHSFTPAKRPPPLPAEGSPVIDRRCRVREQEASGWFRMDFLDEPGRPSERSRWALPCERLEKLELALGEQKDAVFRLSGENFVYRGQLFLLITRDPVIVTPGSSQQEAEPVEAKSPEPPAEEKPSDAEEAATSPPADAGDEEPTSDDIFRELMRDKPGKPIDASKREPRTPAVRPAVAPGPTGSRPVRPSRREVVVSRAITLSRERGDQGWREARFKSDNTLQEPPLRLLPCRMLGRAEKMGGRLRVSGLVTRYRGRRYLLLRKVLRERDLGQF